MIEYVIVETNTAFLRAIIDGPASPHELTIAVHDSAGRVISEQRYALLKQNEEALKMLGVDMDRGVRFTNTAGDATDLYRPGYVSTSPASVYGRKVTHITVTEK